jgi:DNA transposition AAA+ family ATPase
MQIRPHVQAELEASTPPTEVVQERVRQYLALSQLSLSELAHRVHYGPNSLSIFMAGGYISQRVALTDVRIRRALADYMDANPLTADTTGGVSPEDGQLYETANVQVLREWFTRCLNHREMAVVYGPPGAQKTFVLSHLIAQYNLREIPKNGHGTRAY